MEIITNLPKHTGKLSYIAQGPASHFKRDDLYSHGTEHTYSFVREVQMPIIWLVKKRL